MFPQHFSEILVSNKYHLQLQQQLLKDFYTYEEGFPEDFAENCYSAKEIMEILQSTLVKVMEKGERVLLQLLYKIDLPEKEFLKIIQTDQVATELSKAVLQKEINKIYFRMKYS